MNTFHLHLLPDWAPNINWNVVKEFLLFVPHKNSSMQSANNIFVVIFMRIVIYFGAWQRLEWGEAISSLDFGFWLGCFCIFCLNMVKEFSALRQKSLNYNFIYSKEILCKRNFFNVFDITWLCCIWRRTLKGELFIKIEVFKK